MNILKPNLMIQHYTELDIVFFKKHQFSLLICDIDNTLVPHDVALPDEQCITYIQTLLAHQIKVIFVSNNYEERVKTFAKVFQLPYYAFAKKPSKTVYKKILQQYPNEKIVCLGDQILTDVVGGNRNHLFTVKTKPLVERDLHFTKINRFIEKMLSKFWEGK